MEEKKSKWRWGVNRWILLACILLGIAGANYFPPIQPHIQVAPENLTHEPLFTLPVIGSFYLTNTLVAIVLADILVLLLGWKIKKDLEKEKSLRQSAELKISEKDKKIEQLNTRLEETKKTCEVELNQRLELCRIQKEKELLVVRKECQQTLESSQKEYVGKIKDLLDMIEKQKSSGTAKKASGKPVSNSSKS